MGEYRISFDTDLGIVRVEASGELSQRLGEEIITKARLLAAEHNAGILYDVRDATPRVSFFQWFFMPRELKVLRNGPTRSVNAAIVIPVDQAEQYEFYEDVTANMGLTVKIFVHPDEALKWLTASDHSSSRD